MTRLKYYNHSPTDIYISAPSSPAASVVDFSYESSSPVPSTLSDIDHSVTVDSFVPILKQLSRALAFYDPKLYCVDGPIKTADWERLRDYARSVSKFILTDKNSDSQIPPAAFIRLRLKYPDIPLFPSLSDLVIADANTSIDRLDFFVTAPSLKSLKASCIPYGQQQKFLSFLTTIEQQALRTLNLGPGYFLPSSLGAIPRFKNLKHLELKHEDSKLPLGFFDNIGSLSKLETLILDARYVSSATMGEEVADHSKAYHNTSPIRPNDFFNQLTKLHVIGHLPLFEELIHRIMSTKLEDVSLTFIRLSYEEFKAKEKAEQERIQAEENWKREAKAKRKLEEQEKILEDEKERKRIDKERRRRESEQQNKKDDGKQQPVSHSSNAEAYVPSCEIYDHLFLSTYHGLPRRTLLKELQEWGKEQKVEEAEQKKERRIPQPPFSSPPLSASQSSPPYIPSCERLDYRFPPNRSPPPHPPPSSPSHSSSQAYIPSCECLDHLFPPKSHSLRNRRKYKETEKKRKKEAEQKGREGRLKAEQERRAREERWTNLEKTRAERAQRMKQDAEEKKRTKDKGKREEPYHCALTASVTELVRKICDKWQASLKSVSVSQLSGSFRCLLEPPTLPEEVFVAMLFLPNIEYLEVKGWVLDSIQGVFSVAGPIPKLKTLLLPLSETKFGICLPTLKRVASACPRLESFQCHVESLSPIPEYPFLTKVGRLTHGLRELSIGNLVPLPDTNRLYFIARYLFFLFPNLERINTSKEHNAEQWAIIDGIMKEFQSARRQYEFVVTTNHTQ